MRRLISFPVLVISLSAATSAYTQTDSIELDPVTVTASLGNQQSSKTGRNIVIIKGEQFSKLPVQSLDELLRYIPGVEVQSRGPQGAQSDIVLRGGTFQQVLVVIDGLRLNDPNTGHFSSYIPIAPSEIERIEVLKGASSAIYGSDAVGGVIHIITKTGMGKKPLRSQASGQLSIGEYGLVNAQVGGTFASEKTTFSAGMLTANANGQPQRGTRGYFHNNTYALSLKHQLHPNWQLTLRSAYDSRDFAAQNFYTTFASDTASEKVKTFWNTAGIQFQKGVAKLSANLGYKTADDTYTFSPSALPNNNLSKLLQAIVLYEHTISDKTILTGGTQLQSRKITSNDRGNHEVKQAAAFLMLNQSIGKGFQLNPALRIDNDSRAGTEVVPQIAFSYRRKSWQLRGAAGKTIRQADFTERYNNYNKSFVARGSIGNPDLTAEKSFSFEAGADFFAAQNLRVSGTFFRRNQTNLIDFVNTPYDQIPRRSNLSPTGTYALALNVSEVMTTGWETDILWNKQFSSASSITAMVGLLWLNSKTDESRDAFYIRSHAKYMTNFNLRYGFKRWAVAATSIYKVRAERKASTPAILPVQREYFVLNLLAEAAVYRSSVKLFVQADNLFNKKYSDLLGAQMPGRWVMGGFKVALYKS